MNVNKIFRFLLIIISFGIVSCNLYKEEVPGVNIIWIIVEDMSPDFSCYGSDEIQTPNIDSLAAESVRFSNSFVSSPVSSPSRSALMTGMYQTSISVHNHRSSRGEVKIFLPDSIHPIAEILKDKGYFTANCGYDYEPITDYNFIWNPAIYDVEFNLKKDNSNWNSIWENRDSDQPFFIQLHLQGGKKRDFIPENPVNPDDVHLAPYYPSTSLFRENRAEYLNSIKNTDILIGNIINYLKSADLYENTAIFLITDHGADNYRDKQFLYESGIHVPLMLKLPGSHQLNGTVNDKLVMQIDMVPTTLELAGVVVPEWMESQSLLSDKEREYIITARDRCDWTVDRIRSVRSKDLKYIRNYYPDLSYMQPTFRDEWPLIRQAREMFKAGKLDKNQSRFFKPFRPEEELYYLPEDPFELNNLAKDPAWTSKMEEMRFILDTWVEESGDRGRFPETAESYDEAMKNVNTNSSISNFPMLLGASPLEKTEDFYQTELYFKNSSDKTIQITGTFAFDNKSLKKIILDPENEYTYPVKTTRIISNNKPEILTFKAEYEFKNGSRSYDYDLHFATPDIYIIPYDKNAHIIDGNLSEWNSLPIQILDKDKIIAEFAVAYNNEVLLVAVKVYDNELNSYHDIEPWKQDGVEIRLDARPDPWRSAGIGTREFEDHLPVIMSPGMKSDPASVYLPSLAVRLQPVLFGDKELSYACKITNEGFNAEIAIPQMYIIEKQGESWDRIRLNVIIHDKDGNINRRLSWMPEWGNENDYIGSGTFVKMME